MRRRTVGGPRALAPDGAAPRTSRWPRPVAAGAAAVLLAGCASMPGAGQVSRIEPSERADGDSQVRVFGVPPAEGAAPQQIVHGFLEAITSDEADFATAREYLTPEADDAWQPLSGTSVLVDGPGPPAVVNDGSSEEGRASFEISGQQLAFVDEEHVYRPDDGEFRASFGLNRVGDEWRIDELPDGLVLGEQDFRRIYRPVSTYFYADHDGTAGLPAEARNALVADPIYLRHRVDLVGETVQALLSGPSNWLEPVVASRFPTDVTLLGREGPAIDEEGVLTLRLGGLPSRLSEEHCRQMASQMLHTVGDLGIAELNEVRLAGPGRVQCRLTASEAGRDAPGLLVGQQDRQYFLEEDTRLMVVEDGEAPRAVGGALGDGDVELRSAAVRRDGARAAVVSADGSALFTADLSQDLPLSQALYASDSTGDDAGLSTPSWDGLGDLWFADRDPQDPQLLRMTSGVGAAHPVEVPDLRTGQRIEEARVASDGVRIALLVDEGDGRTTLQLGRIERSNDEDGHAVSVRELREVAPYLESVVAMSWAGGSRLLVVGRPPGGAEQMTYVNTDGSTYSLSNVAGPSEVTGLAASEEEDHPLLTESSEGIARQHQDGTWRIVSAEGRAPVYPG